MKRIPVLVCAASLAQPFAAQITPPITWQKAIGGSQQDDLLAIIGTDDGGSLAVGASYSSNGDVPDNNGSSDALIVKLDVAGAIQWVRTYGGSAFDVARDVVQTPDGGYLVAAVSQSDNGDVPLNMGVQDAWVLKLDAMGDIEWQYVYGGSQNESIFACAVAAGGGYLIGGETASNDGDVSGNHGSFDMWVIALDDNGALQWQRCYGGSSGENMRDLAALGDGGAILAGGSGSSDGDVTPYTGAADVWVVRIDSVGDIEWERCYGGSNGELGFSVQATLDGGFVVGCNTSSMDGMITASHGDQELWVMKLNSAGDLQWERALGGSNWETSGAVLQLDDGRIAVAGESFSSDGDLLMNQGYADFWVALLEPAGNLLWQRSMGGAWWDRDRAITVGSDGELLITGVTESSNGDVTGSHGGKDGWVVKMAAAFNQVTGTLFSDPNGNAVHDPGEPVVAWRLVEETGTGQFTLSNTDGSYMLALFDTGSYVVAPAGALHHSIAPPQRTITFPIMDLIDPLNDFAFQPAAVANDLSISLSPVGPFRPGWNARYDLHYQNVGTTSIAPAISFQLDADIAFDSASITPTAIFPDSVMWSLGTLDPWEGGTIQVRVLVDSTASIGTVLDPTAWIAPLVGDAVPADNHAVFPAVVTASFDPNDITVDRSTIGFAELSVPPPLEYLIRFQNTGTDTAFTVTVRNALPANTAFTTFEFVGASHPVQVIYDNTVQVMLFRFDDILLPDHNVNEPASHGYVRYRIKPLSTLAVGDSILDRASIYFDSNEPVITNTAVTVVEASTGIGQASTTDDFLLYPNPASSMLRISAAVPITDGRVTLTDFLGCEVLHGAMQGTTTDIDLRRLSQGLYLLSVLSEKGQFTAKVLVE